MTRSRGERAIVWIERYCVHPFGDQRGRPVRLANSERDVVRLIYDSPAEPHLPADIVGPLASFLVLLHVVGPEGKRREPMPPVETDPWTVWRAAGPALRPYLTHKGTAIVCRELGTSFSAVA